MVNGTLKIFHSNGDELNEPQLKIIFKRNYSKCNQFLLCSLLTVCHSVWPHDIQSKSSVWLALITYILLYILLFILLSLSYNVFFRCGSLNQQCQFCCGESYVVIEAKIKTNLSAQEKHIINEFGTSVLLLLLLLIRWYMY